jgi:hypothetical protein
MDGKNSAYNPYNSYKPYKPYKVYKLYKLYKPSRLRLLAYSLWLIEKSPSYISLFPQAPGESL